MSFARFEVRLALLLLLPDTLSLMLRWCHYFHIDYYFAADDAIIAVADIFAIFAEKIDVDIIFWCHYSLLRCFITPLIAVCWYNPPPTPPSTSSFLHSSPLHSRRWGEGDRGGGVGVFSSITFLHLSTLPSILPYPPSITGRGWERVEGGVGSHYFHQVIYLLLSPLLLSLPLYCFITSFSFAATSCIAYRLGHYHFRTYVTNISGRYNFAIIILRSGILSPLHIGWHAADMSYFRRRQYARFIHCYCWHYAMASFSFRHYYQPVCDATYAEFLQIMINITFHWWCAE